MSDSLLKCYSFLKNICFTRLSNKFEVKFSSSDGFLMIDSGISGMPLRKWWYVPKHNIAYLNWWIGLHTAASSSSYLFLNVCECHISINPGGWNSCWVITLSIVNFWCFTESRLSDDNWRSFPDWQHSMMLQSWIGIKQWYFVAFFGECSSLQEFTRKAPTIFKIWRPDYSLVHCLQDLCVGW
jgi:hypothetical protein